MSIIVSVKINEGIVMAADSATTFEIGQIYEHTNKLVNLVKGLPIGIMTCGAGGIGNASIATLLKDLRQLSNADSGKWVIDPAGYTMQSVAVIVHDFFEERAKGANFTGHLRLRICGYSKGRAQPEVWEVCLNAGKPAEPSSIQKEDGIGPLWDGEYEAMDRLILGVGNVSDQVLAEHGMSRDHFEQTRSKFIEKAYENLIIPAAPIQDAIDLARFMVETTKGFTRFAVTRKKTVGGLSEIAAITKHEGFRWVQRKLFYPRELNP